jgi:hypothetical protein
MSLWYLVGDAVSSLFSGRDADQSSDTDGSLSASGGERPDAASDPTPITPEPWIDWKRHGRVLKVAAQILFVLLAIWLKFRSRSR